MVSVLKFVIWLTYSCCLCIPSKCRAFKMLHIQTIKKAIDFSLFGVFFALVHIHTRSVKRFNRMQASDILENGKNNNKNKSTDRKLTKQWKKKSSQRITKQPEQFINKVKNRNKKRRRLKAIYTQTKSETADRPCWRSEQMHWTLCCCCVY